MTILPIKRLPSQKRLRELLDYNTETGVLTWRFRPEARGSWNAQYAGMPALTGWHRGYRVGSIEGEKFRTHRVIWCWLTGDEPPEIDHINGNKSDNRACNLRASDRISNLKNCRLPKDNTSGFCGVYWASWANRWRSVIGINGRSLHIGYFNTRDEAISARKSKECELGFSERHGL